MSETEVPSHFFCGFEPALVTYCSPSHFRGLDSSWTQTLTAPSGAIARCLRCDALHFASSAETCVEEISLIPS